MASKQTIVSSSRRVFDNDDLLTEILIRVPIKPLLRSKSVCKTWNSTIKSDPFARTHSAHPPNFKFTSGVFAINGTPGTHHKYYFLSVPFDFHRSTTPSRIQLPLSTWSRLQSCCNGLLLFWTLKHFSSKSTDGEIGATQTLIRYRVYNPATCQSKVLPDLVFTGNVCVGETLAFDPSRFKGFKVVCMANIKAYRYHRIFWYCSSDSGGGGVWKKMEPSIWPPYIPQGFYWNGSVHWIYNGRDSLYFDVQIGTTKRFLSPKCYETRHNAQLFECNRNLHYVCVVQDRSNMRIDFKVFAFQGYGQDWILQHKSEVMFDMCSQLSEILVVCEETRVEIVLNWYAQTFAYDLKRGTWRRLLEFAPLNTKGLLWWNACAYTPSFALF